jgi:guanine deaminase
LWREHPGILVRTHIKERPRNRTAQLFPQREYSISTITMGWSGGALCWRGVHLGEAGSALPNGTALAHCPTSTCSSAGLFRRRVKTRGKSQGSAPISAAAPVFATRRGHCLRGRPAQRPHVESAAPLAGRRARLTLDDRIGAIAPGREADLVVLDPAATPLLKLRNARAESIADQLFALMMLGDDRAVRATYLAGRCAYQRAA